MLVSLVSNRTRLIFKYRNYPLNKTGLFMGRSTYFKMFYCSIGRTIFFKQGNSGACETFIGSKFMFERRTKFVLVLGIIVYDLFVI